MKKMLWNILLGLSVAAGLQAGVEIGKTAPNFKLSSSDGKTVQLSDYKGKTVVLEWVNEGCPFVKKHYDKSGNMPALQKKYTEEGVVWLGISSSAEGKQGYWATGEEANEWKAKMKAAPSALLLDPEGTVGRLYGAQTTPHMYIVDKKGKLVYQGAIDSIPSFKEKDIAKSENYVSLALDELAAGRSVSKAETKSYGCSVKYSKK